jgi:hypothetical protein
MMRLTVLILVSTCLFLTACIDGIHRRDRKANSGIIFSDYRIWGDEEGGNVSVKLQFFRGGPDGDATLLTPPASVRFDGEELGADSSRFNGAWYASLRPVEDFGGPHEIIFTDDSARIYKTAFEFPIISFKNEVPAVITRGDLVFEVNGLKAGDRIRLSLVDTTFPGTGLERLDTVKDGRILVSKKELGSLKNGPINLNLNREEDRWLNQPIPERGRLYISYSLKREFVLQDSANISLPLRPEK